MSIEDIDKAMRKIDEECRLIGHMPIRSGSGCWYCYRCKRVLNAPKQTRKRK